ncbi:unnamed protein product [Porites evermanni]|uniref:HSF-type DNA-binding domain-containing protein n=1 Tax=Porites evermanni TaxID=104178 RepID=A0ABN8LJS2_9CNID|nr:unnamed protein product [Porites evermanni]
MASESHEEEEYFPSFPSKLFHMVENDKYNRIIWWTENGDGFFICKEREFVKSEILDKYKVKSYGSFTRQLGKYGFHKKRGPTQERANGPSSYYCHDEGYFKRGCKDLLVNIIKKENQGTKKETSSKAGKD